MVAGSDASQQESDGPVSPIAVVGLACRYPGADSPRTLWENILARRQAFRRMPDCRLPIADYHDPDPAAPDKTYSTRAALIDGFEFDWAAHRVPKSAFETADPVHWLALDVALRALADAGYRPETVPRQRTRVVVGNSVTGEFTRVLAMRPRWPFVARCLRSAAEDRGLSAPATAALLEATEARYKSVFPLYDEDTLAGMLSNTIAGRICNYLDLHGGGYTVDGACSSSLLAVIDAAQALSQHHVDLAFAGGVDISLDPLEIVGFAKAGALTRSEMRVYDRRAAGFIPGEGAGFVVLKRLEDARAAGDTVYAVLRGWGVSSDGKAGLTAPTRDGQCLALERAYGRAGYGPGALDFVEGHGTGTTLGDRIEIQAIAQACERAGDVPPRRIGMTSFKSVVGHTKAAAGVGGLIKAVVACNRRVLPPTAGCEEPNAEFGETARFQYPILHGEMRPRDATLHAGVSAMGFGGINTHVTLTSGDGPDARLQPGLPERALLASSQRSELFVLGGQSAGALADRVREVRQLSHGISVGELADLSANLAAEREGRAASPVRVSLVADTPDMLAELLEQAEQRLRGAGAGAAETGVSTTPDRRLWTGLGAPPAGGPVSVGYVFPGQGSQQLGMAQRLVERFDWARELAEQADWWLEEVGAEPIRAAVFAPVDRARDERELAEWQRRLTRTELAQPAICLASLIWLGYLGRLGVRPTAVAGHSLGELTALAAAGALDARSLLQLAALRGRAMAEGVTGVGAMASLRCSEQQAEALIAGEETDGGQIVRAGETLVIANLNTPRQVVISGETDALDRALQRAEALGIRAKRLPVSAAFHSPLVAAAADTLRGLDSVPERAEQLKVPVLSGVGGKVLQADFALRDHIADQVLARVDFNAVMRGLAERCQLLLEVGPGRVLSGLVEDTFDEAAGPTCLPLEGRAGRDGDLNTAMACLFAHGAPLSLGPLFERRLTREFVSPAARRFIVSPLERPFERVEAAPAAETVDSGDTASTLAAASGLSQAELSEYLAERGSFLGEFIRLDRRSRGGAPSAGNRRPAASTELLSTGSRPDPLVPSSSARAAPAPAPAPPVEDGVDGVERLLLARIAARTGFALDGLDAGLRLLDDLRIDSIKVAELVADTAQQLGVSGQIDSSQFANATIGELALVLEGKRKDAHTESSGGPSAAGSPARSPSGGAWVRNFAAEWLPAPMAATPAPRPRWGKRRVLLLAEGEALARQLQKALEGQGATVTRCGLDEAPEDRHSSLTHAYDDYVALFPAGGAAGVAEHDAVALLVRRVNAVVRSLPRETSEQQRGRVAWVRIEGPTAHPLETALTSFAATLQLERPTLRVASLSVPETIGAAELEQLLSQELGAGGVSTGALFSAARYDGELRRTERVPRLQQPCDYPARGASLGPDDVVLVSGGAKGITAECALALAQATGARMVLAGSSPAPEEASGMEEQSGAVAATLARYKALGLRAHYRCCDLSDGPQVDALVGELRQRFGRIDAVIHGAGLNRPRRLEQVGDDAALAEIAPKLLGALNLFRALEDDPPRLFVALTSIIGVTGLPGNAWYALANESLDLSLGRFAARHPRLSALSLAFSVWDEVGMAVHLESVQQLARSGVEAISPAEGSARFVSLVRGDPGVRQVVVTARLATPAGLGPWQPGRAVSAPSHRFIDDVRSFHPGIEFLGRTRLTLQQDPYLEDHNFAGNLLFPTVFGLEAMAQAVAQVTGEADLLPIVVEDIELALPIVVSPRAGLPIEIQAVAAERIEPGGPTRVRVAIRTEQTSYGPEHFAATFVVGADLPARRDPIAWPSPALPDPAADRVPYGTVLFQGPRFQRLQRIARVDGQHCLFAAHHDPGQGFVLGDPYLRDALLQSLQLLVHPETVLPTRIARLEIHARPASGDAGCLGCADYREREGEIFHGEVRAVNAQGLVLDSLQGCQARAVRGMRPQAKVDASSVGERNDDGLAAVVSPQHNPFRLVGKN